MNSDIMLIKQNNSVTKEKILCDSTYRKPRAHEIHGDRGQNNGDF